MARYIDPLVVGKVIGDVLDMFAPAVDFTVDYGSKQVANGYEIKPSAAAVKPTVRISGSDGHSFNLYTLVMVDPDAPSPSDPSMREWLHWIVVDIPEGADAAGQGEEVIPYMGPQPPTGIHRYIFVLFKQNDTLAGKFHPPEARGKFNTREFATSSGLGLPVAAMYFNSQKEHTSSRRR